MEIKQITTLGGTNELSVKHGLTDVELGSYENANKKGHEEININPSVPLY